MNSRRFFSYTVVSVCFPEKNEINIYDVEPSRIPIVYTAVH